jgi:hypothetical protein
MAIREVIANLCDDHGNTVKIKRFWKVKQDMFTIVTEVRGLKV